MMNTNSENLLRFKKIFAFVASICLILLSVWFSQKGFGVESKESNENYLWIGWLLGATVQVVQLVFNTNIKKLSPTLIFSGILAYGYSIYTNFSGLKAIFTTAIFAAVVGLIIDILAEPLFAWSVDAHDSGDVIGNIGKLVGFKFPVQQQTRSENVHQSPYSKPVNLPYRSSNPSSPSVPSHGNKPVQKPPTNGSTWLQNGKK